MALGDLKIRIGIDATGIEKGLMKAQKKLTKSASKFAAIGSNISIGISAPLGLLGQQAITTAAEFETLETGLKVLTGSAEAGAAAFQRLKEFSAATPFQLNDLVSANNTMMGFGLSADDAFNSLNQLGDIAAVMGSDLNSLSIAFGQSAASGVAMTADINQFINQGIPMYKLLEEVTGNTTAELKDMASKSQITFPLIQEALAKATSEGGMFFEGMKQGSQTIGGILSTFQDKLSLALGTLGKSIADAINFKEVMAKLGDTIGRVTNFFAGLSDGTKRIIIAVTGAIAVLGPLMFAMGSLTNVVVSAISGLRVLNSVLLANPFGVIAAAITAVVIGFRQLYKHSNAFRGVVNKLVNTVKNTFKKAFDTAKQVVNALRTAFAGANTETKRTKSGFKAIAEFIGKVVLGIFQKFVDAISFVVDGFMNLYNSSERFRGVLFGIVAGIKTMITETLQGLTKLGDAIVLLFDGQFKEAAKTAAAGAKQFALAGFEAGKATIEGYKKGVDSELRIKHGVIDPEKVIPVEEETIEPAAKKSAVAVAQTLQREIQTELAKIGSRPIDIDLTLEPNIKGLQGGTALFSGMADKFQEALEQMGAEFRNFTKVFDLLDVKFANMSDKMKDKFKTVGLAITGVFQQLSAAFDQYNENQLAKLDAKHQREMEYIEASTHSEERKAQLKEIAERKYEKESGKIKKRQARKDKALAIFEAVINTASAVAKVAAFPPLAAIVAAIGAAQIATIAAAPIPMAKGGILTGPTNILAGEYMGARNNPEIIAPLDKLKSMIGGETNINLSGAFRLTGNDLILAVEQANKNRIRQGGQSIF